MSEISPQEIQLLIGCINDSIKLNGLAVNKALFGLADKLNNALMPAKEEKLNNTSVPATPVAKKKEEKK